MAETPWLEMQKAFFFPGLGKKNAFASDSSMEVKRIRGAGGGAKRRSVFY
jgi:hypothetical protein